MWSVIGSTFATLGHLVASFFHFLASAGLRKDRAGSYTFISSMIYSCFGILAVNDLWMTIKWLAKYGYVMICDDYHLKVIPPTQDDWLMVISYRILLYNYFASRYLTLPGTFFGHVGGPRWRLDYLIGQSLSGWESNIVIGFLRGGLVIPLVFPKVP